ncbi:MAG TPA: GNAT family N-acetyltransferase [Anaeromyxobacteraceae bacterium]
MDYVVRFASTPQDREAAMEVRRAVFEVEQNVPRPLDRDAHDLNAAHVVVYAADGRCVGTGRVVRVDNRSCQIGRMAVVATERKHGVGAAVLEALERMAALRGTTEVTVHAQLPAEPFYRNRGYVTEGGVFLEEGVPHVLMRKPLMR